MPYRFTHGETCFEFWDEQLAMAIQNLERVTRQYDNAMDDLSRAILLYNEDPANDKAREALDQCLTRLLEIRQRKT